MSLMTTQVFELKEERKILLDRLASIGLGSPLYQRMGTEVTTEDDIEVEKPFDPEQDILERLNRLRHRPAKLADALTRKAYRDYANRSGRPKVAWIPQAEGEDKITGALDQAEEMGKQAGSSLNDG